MTDNNINMTFFPNLKNPVWWAFEKYSGNKHIGIKNYFHLFFLTLLMALAISDIFNPAWRACFRASLSKSSNSSNDGGEIVLKMTEFLISSGITTWPFDDSRVVAKLVLI
jgi:hypothetical protein